MGLVAAIADEASCIGFGTDTNDRRVPVRRSIEIGYDPTPGVHRQPIVEVSSDSTLAEVAQQRSIASLGIDLKESAALVRRIAGPEI